MREQILAMQPGRELDALVAEKVMGLKINHANYPDRVWSPSTDLEAAWEVVGKLSGNDGVYSFHVYRTNVSFHCHFMFEMPEDGDFEEYYAEALTAPEAICKAALLAVMEE